MYLYSVHQGYQITQNLFTLSLFGIYKIRYISYFNLYSNIVIKSMIQNSQGTYLSTEEFMMTKFFDDQ